MKTRLITNISSLLGRESAGKQNQFAAILAVYAPFYLKIQSLLFQTKIHFYFSYLFTVLSCFGTNLSKRRLTIAQVQNQEDIEV